MTRQEPPGGNLLGNASEALISIIAELTALLAQDNLSMA